jgi:hypothetical protein
MYKLFAILSLCMMTTIGCDIRSDIPVLQHKLDWCLSVRNEPRICSNSTDFILPMYIIYDLLKFKAKYLEVLKPECNGLEDSLSIISKNIECLNVFQGYIDGCR